MSPLEPLLGGTFLFYGGYVDGELANANVVDNINNNNNSN